MKLYIGQNQEELHLDPKMLASGGEGSLYAINAPEAWTNYVAKVYHPAKRSAEKEKKINYLIAHAPAYSTAEEAATLIWPIECLYTDSGAFVGFLMPRAEGVTLEALCGTRLPRKLAQTWKSYTWSESTALRKRLALCKALSTAVAQLHATRRYVIVDLKPDNILVQPNGKVALVDLDAVEIIEDNKTLFAATVVTPEYAPPEYYEGVTLGKTTLRPSWDRFSLAVILYKLLCGIHPFAGSARAPYEDCNSLGDKIKAGLFVHHKHKRVFFHVIPTLHNRFDRLDRRLQAAFHTSLTQAPEDRTTARDWEEALMQSPLLLVQRPMPSGVVQKYKMTSVEWFNTTLSKVHEDVQLVVKNPTVSRRRSPLQRLLYQSVVRFGSRSLQIAKNSLRFGTVVLGVALGLTGIGAIALGDIGLVWAFLEGTFSILSVPIRILLAGLFSSFWSFTFVFLLFFGFTSDFFGTVTKQGFIALKKNIRNTLSLVVQKVTQNPKKRMQWLNSQRYELYTARTKLKTKLRAAKQKVKTIHETREFLQTQYRAEINPILEQTQKDIKAQIEQENEKMRTYDRKVQTLIEGEAEALRTLFQQSVTLLAENPKTAYLHGKTAAQKLKALPFWKKHALKNEPNVEARAAETQKILQAHQKELKAQEKAIKTRFSKLHEPIQSEMLFYTEKLNMLIEAGRLELRRASAMDEKLLNSTYRDTFREEQQLQYEIAELTQTLEALNEKVHKIRSEIKSIQSTDTFSS